MLIKRTDRSAHYYLKTGEPFYTIEKKDGSGPRPVKITDAFKVGAYRSVTNVLSVLDKPGLDAWKQEQCVLSALTLPRTEGENEHQFAERAMNDADEQVRKAAEQGTRLHELAQAWLTSGQLPAPPEQARILAPFQAWCQSNLDQSNGLVMPVESVILNHEHGYAGRVDLPVRMADGSIAMIDLKTQDVKNAKPTWYDEWPLQLAAYSRGIFADGSYPPPFPWRLISIVINRIEPGCWMHEWTDSANPLASSEPHFQAFLNLCRVWSYLKGGTPGIDMKKAA